MLRSCWKPPAKCQARRYLWDPPAKSYPRQSIKRREQGTIIATITLNKDGNLLAITSAADIYKIRGDTGDIFWSRNTADSLYADATDFFVSSEIVINDDKVIFSSGNNTFLLKLENGETLWKQEQSQMHKLQYHQEEHEARATDSNCQ